MPVQSIVAARPDALPDLPSQVSDAISALIGVQQGTSLLDASKSFNFESKFAEIKRNTPGCGSDEEVQRVALLLQCAHTMELLTAPVLAGIAQGYCNLVIRNKSFLDTADTVDAVLSTLKSKLASAESTVQEVKREKSNLLDEYTALGALHQQVKADAMGVEGRLNIRIGDLTQELNRLKSENDALIVRKEQLTKDAADLCAMLESRDGEVLNVDQLRSINENYQIELIQLRQRISELSDENTSIKTQLEFERCNFATFRAEADAARSASLDLRQEQILSLEAAVKSSQIEFEEAKEKIGALQFEVKHLREEMACLQDEKDSALADYATLAASNQKSHAASEDREHSLQAKIRELQEQLQNLRNTSDLEADLAQRSEEVERAKAELTLKTSELATARSTCSALEMELSAALGDLSEAQEKARVLKETLQAETEYSVSKEADKKVEIALLTSKLKETEESWSVRLKESQQNVSELTKTCQTLQVRLKELSSGSNSVALREAFSSLDQTADLPEVAVWLSKRIQEHPDAAEEGESGGERGAIRAKILEIHANNENSLKSLRSEIKRLSRSQVTTERALAEARELQHEYADLCEVLKAEKAMILNNSSPGKNLLNESSDLVSTPVVRVSRDDADHSLSFSEPILFIEIGNFECRVGLWDPRLYCFSNW